MNSSTVYGGLLGAFVGGTLGWITGTAITQRNRGGGPKEAPELGAILGGLGLGVVGAAVGAGLAPATSTAVASNTTPTVIPPAGANGDDATQGGTTLPPAGA
jgi:hypothetical protein